MDSRCTISIKNDDGSISSTYAYTHGDMGNTGLILYQNYQSCEKIQTLMSMGHIQRLDKEIDIPAGISHSLDNPAIGITSFLRRDSKQKITQFQAQNFDTLYEYKKELAFEDDNYFFNYMEKLWYVFNPEKDQFQELGKALLKNKELLLSEETISYIEKQQAIYQSLKDLGFNYSLDSAAEVAESSKKPISSSFKRK